MKESSQSASFPEKLRQWLVQAVGLGASDLHLNVGYPPVVRLHGELIELAEEAIAPQPLDDLLANCCPPDLYARLEADKNADWAFDLVSGKASLRFRANLFRAGGHLGGCFRVVPTKIPDLTWAGFP